MRTRTWLFGVAAATTIALAACGPGDDAEDGAAPAGTSAAPSAAAPSAADSAGAGDSGGSGDATYTKQGTTLKIGEKAVVPFKSSGKTGSLGVTVTGIDKGSAADLTPLKLGSQAKGMVPYYIRITVSNESDVDFSYSSLTYFDGLLSDGSEAQMVSVIGDFAKCDSGDGGKGFTKKGATYKTCALALAAAASSVTGAEYSSGSYADQAPNTDYGDAPLTWK